MNSDIRLSENSYIVLGCLSLLGGEATPYAIERFLSQAIGPFRPYAHSRLYAEPDRLADAGYVTVRQERRGRRRKVYALTREGRAALRQWRAEPVRAPFEVRDAAILKMIFGADPGALAESQVEILRAELVRAEEVKEQWESVAPKGTMLAADFGIKVRRTALDFWADLAQDQAPDG